MNLSLCSQKTVYHILDDYQQICFLISQKLLTNKSYRTDINDLELTYASKPLI
jgi:hypothetical protein